MPSNREAISDWVLSESEIKEEPIIKEEPFDYTDDDVLVVTFPHSDAWSFGSSTKIKTKAYDQKIAGKNGTGRKVPMKLISSKKKSNLLSIVAAKTKNKSKSKGPKDRIKSFVLKAEMKQHECSSHGQSTFYTTTVEGHTRKQIGRGLFPCSHFSNRLIRKLYLQGNMLIDFNRFGCGSWKFRNEVLQTEGRQL